jgi:hypothetical protein
MGSKSSEQLAQLVLEMLAANTRPIAKRSGATGITVELGKDSVEFQLPARQIRRRRSL